MLRKLVAYLQEHKAEIVREEEILKPSWDPTYGASDPRTATIEIVDFEALCQAIDEFSGTFEQQEK